MDEKLNKILEILGVVQSDIVGLKEDVVGIKADIVVMHTDISSLKVQVTELNSRTERIEHQLNTTFEAVAYTKEEVTDSRFQQDRHELILGEIAKTLLEHNALARTARSV